MKTILAVCLLAIASPALAQNDPASHDQAARDLVQALHLEQNHVSSFETLVAGATGNNPVMAQFNDLLIDFFKEFLSWKVVEPEYIRIYREAFSEPELRQLTAFYKSPIGVKYAEFTPELMKQGVAISQKMLQEHMPELQRRIEARININ